MIKEAMRNLLTERPSFIPTTLENNYSGLGYIRFTHTHVKTFRQSLTDFVNNKTHYPTEINQQYAQQVVENDAVKKQDGWCNPSFIYSVANYYEIPIEVNHHTKDFRLSYEPTTSSITYQAYLSYQLLPDGGTLGHYEYAISDFNKSLEQLEKKLTPSTK